MYQFFESIRVKDGIVENLGFHQLRVNKTLKAHDTSETKIVLEKIIQDLMIPTIGLFKLRIAYALNGDYQTEWVPYQLKHISSFALVDIHGHSYDFKFSNRAWIDKALKQSGKDEIIMHDNGIIKDCSYTNIVFNNGGKWYTPQLPLLEGTQRAKLIGQGIIEPKSIHIKDLANFIKFRCVNALIDWENAVDYDILLIDQTL
ncbi:MAG: aminotransferase class IV [Sediminibacterium sp.]